MKEFKIHKNEENQRLDKYLKKLLPNATTSFLYKMLRKKNIVINGKKASGNEILAVDDTIQIYFSDDTFAKFSANTKALQAEYESLKSLPMKGLSVIFEDEDILVVNKPANMLSQKAKEQDISANENLLGYLIRNNALSLSDFATFRPSVCNRLDRNTTGLLLMGKTLAGSQMLSEMLRNRTVKKYYRAIVRGKISDASHLSGYLTKDYKTNKVTITKENLLDAVPIETAYEPLEITDDHTFLEIHLITGKTHQIRAHLASIGHPIIGDMKYGDGNVNKAYQKDFGVKSQLLHAYRLEFPDGRVLVAPLPDYYNKIMMK